MSSRQGQNERVIDIKKQTKLEERRNEETVRGGGGGGGGGLSKEEGKTKTNSK